MKRYIIILLVFIVLISTGLNFYQFGEIRRAETQLTIVNNRVLDNIEQYSRWSIRFIDEIQALKESGNTDEFMTQTVFSHLQNSLEDVVEYYTYFVDLRNENRGSEGICTESLDSLRSIRNVVNHNLQDKFEMNEYQFTANDYLFLQDLEEALQEFLSSIYRIAEANENQLVIEISQEEGERLLEVSTSLMDLGSRYRHSILTQNQEEFLSEAEAKSQLTEIALNWVEEDSLENGEIEGIQHRNGISHYALETEELLLWLDAKVGTLRYLEYSPDVSEAPEEEIRRKEAVEIAREFYEYFQGPSFEDMTQEVFTYNQEDNGEMVYAFRFTPMTNGLRLSSDAFEINVGANTGEVVRFRNRYYDTLVPTDAKGTLDMLEVINKDEDLFPMSVESIEELHREQFPNLDYQGRAVIRNFYTEFQPRVTKVFFEEIDGQRAALYFDEYTGWELERIYYPYEPFLGNN